LKRKVFSVTILAMVQAKRIAQTLLRCFNQGGRVLICGNGGSAAMTSHFVAELVCKYAKERKPLPAISLVDNNAILTAISNDFGFEYVFSRQVEAIGKPGDLLITLSTSGNSKNCLEAIEKAHQLGINVLDFPRRGDTTGDIQDYQLNLIHKICGHIEDNL